MTEVLLVLLAAAIPLSFASGFLAGAFDKTAPNSNSGLEPPDRPQDGPASLSEAQGATDADVREAVDRRETRGQT